MSAFLTGLLILLGFTLGGEAVAAAAHLPVPGNVLGMVALAVALRRGWLPLEAVKPAAEGLLRHLALFFVPPGVGLMVYADLIRQEWLAMIAANVVGWLAVLVVVGVVQQRLERRPPT